MVGADRDELAAIRIVSVGNRPRAVWAEGHLVRIPGSILDRCGWRRLVAADGRLAIPDAPARISAADVVALRERCAFTDRPPASARLPWSYHAVPGRVRALIASAIGRWNRTRSDVWATFPGWPIDLSTDLLDDLRSDAGDTIDTRRPAPVLLTHDIDSPEGLSSLVDRFLPIEEAVGARSTNYIVPCGWRVDDGRVREVTGRGHGVGVHGHDHANRTPFAPPAERQRRLDAARR